MSPYRVLETVNVLLGDLNAQVGNEVVVRAIMPKRNESGEKLLELCMKQELVTGNTMFKSYL